MRRENAARFRDGFPSTCPGYPTAARFDVRGLAGPPWAAVGVSNPNGIGDTLARMARVELTKHLFQFFPDLAERDILVEGTTVAEVVRALEAIAPGIEFYLCDERGRLRQHVNVFIGENAVIDRRELSDRVEPDSRVFVMQALSGG